MKKKFINPITVCTMSAALLSLGVFIYFALSSKINRGFIIRPYSSKDSLTNHMESLRIDITNLTENYSEQVKLILSALGFIAALVTFQSKKNLKLSKKSWGLLLAGIIILLCSLILCLLGKELLITMSINNSVNIESLALTFSRKAINICLILSTICVSFFALEISFNPQASNSNINIHEDD